MIFDAFSVEEVALEAFLCSHSVEKLKFLYKKIGLGLFENISIEDFGI